MTWSPPTPATPFLYLPLAGGESACSLRDCATLPHLVIPIDANWLACWTHPSVSTPATICTSLQCLLHPLAQLAVKCQRSLNVYTKDGPHDLVTDCDIGLELLIRHWFNTHLPTHILIGEESDKTPLRPDVPIWYLDPIDGTANFTQQNTAYCINLAAVYQDKPYISIIVHPPSDSYAYTTPTNHTPVSDPLGTNRLCCEFYPHKKDEKKRFDSLLSTTGLHPYQTQALGLSLLHMTQGACDFFYKEAAKPWDIIAGAILLATNPKWRVDFFDHTGKQTSLFATAPPFLAYLNHCLQSDCRIGSLVISPQHDTTHHPLIYEELGVKTR